MRRILISGNPAYTRYSFSSPFRLIRSLVHKRLQSAKKAAKGSNPLTVVGIIAYLLVLLFSFPLRDRQTLRLGLSPRRSNQTPPPAHQDNARRMRDSSLFHPTGSFYRAHEERPCW